MTKERAKKILEEIQVEIAFGGEHVGDAPDKAIGTPPAAMSIRGRYWYPGSYWTLDVNELIILLGVASTRNTGGAFESGGFWSWDNTSKWFSWDELYSRVEKCELLT